MAVNTNTFIINKCTFLFGSSTKHLPDKTQQNQLADGQILRLVQVKKTATQNISMCFKCSYSHKFFIHFKGIQPILHPNIKYQ